MKDLISEYKKPILGLMTLGLALGLGGCNVYDEAEDCDPVYKVRFIYDWNMSGGDGFSSQVNSISLWVFDHNTGLLVKKYSDGGVALSKAGYLLELKDLEPGNYDFIAWGGLEGSESFIVSSNVSRESDLNVGLITENKDGLNISDSRLSPLFYGSLDNLTVEDVRGEKIYTVYLMKDTNNINLSLQHISEETLSAKDFTIYMVDSNGNLGYDNSLLAGEEIYYYPWSTNSGDINLPGDNLNFLQVELSTSRLIADRNPVITILDNETGNTVYTIPIVEWAKKLRSLQHLSMDDQEYLDREHEYTVMLYLIDEANGWKATSIIINGFELE
ncbi:MAG: FimB/Mfa2 family fimbrial subunit [Muribaculaceae bacterium]|nr:FimB/Mfa2 family fimbrial subunit [Muribaculaceae bacterium]